MVAHPTETVDPSGDQTIDGIINRTKYMTELNYFNKTYRVPISYSFTDRASDYEQINFPGFEAFNQRTQGHSEFSDLQKVATRKILDEITGVTDTLLFQERTGDSDGSASMRFANSDSLTLPGALGEGGLPSEFPQETEGDVWINSDQSAWGANFDSLGSPQIGNGEYWVQMHETLHALGLEHADDATSFGASPTSHQSHAFTVMSIKATPTATDGYANVEAGSFAQSLMQDDIAALQFLYGADYSARGRVWSGDTTYQFDPNTGEMSINGVGQGVPVANKIFRTIWDGNGEDTYDFSNYTDGVKVDLNPGAWTQIYDGDARAAGRTFWRFDPQESAQTAVLDTSIDALAPLAPGNVANARLFNGDTRSLIENAIGGSANDVLIGNQVGNELRGNRGSDYISGGDGRDYLYGGDGHDTLDGGAGSDRIYGDDGNDRIYDYRDRDGDVVFGGDGEDTIITGFGRDYVQGGADDDRIYTGDSNDRIFGGLGNDVINAGAGDDKIYAWLDDDTIYGGTGSDTFYFNSARGSVTNIIKDFEDGVDVINFRVAFTVNSVGNLRITDDDVSTTIRYFDAGGDIDTIILEGVGNRNVITADDFIF